VRPAKWFNGNRNTQAGHLQPDFQPMALRVLRAQLETVLFDQAEDALEAGAIQTPASLQRNTSRESM